eukprot:m.265395 g.265395  ORF g.265395 m.265395 type:complete len:319 (+) comp28989_c0_seq1:3-959(+)
MHASFDCCLVLVLAFLYGSQAFYCDTTVGKCFDGQFFGWCKRNEVLAEPTPIKVIGAGFGRTGTSSLAKALTDLGYKVCHVRDVANDPVLADCLANDDAECFLNAMSERGFNATVDTAAAGYWLEQLAAYPNAKVLVTVRDTPQQWFKSWTTLMNTFQITGHYPLSAVPAIARLRKALRNPLDRLFGSAELSAKCTGYDLKPFPPTDESVVQQCLDAYEAYNAKVLKTVPEGQVKVFNVKMGYAPLCEFLDIDADKCPTEFPWTNSKQEILMMKTGNYAMWGLLWLAHLIPVVLLWWAFRCFVRRGRSGEGEEKKKKK